MSCIISSPGALFLNNLRNVGPGYEFWNRANVVAAKQAASYLHAVHVSFIHLKKKKKNISVQAEPYCRQTALRPAVVVISYCTIPEVYLAVI